MQLSHRLVTSRRVAEQVEGDEPVLIEGTQRAPDDGDRVLVRVAFIVQQRMKRSASKASLTIPFVTPGHVDTNDQVARLEPRVTQCVLQLLQRREAISVNAREPVTEAMLSLCSQQARTYGIADIALSAITGATGTPAPVTEAAAAEDGAHVAGVALETPGALPLAEAGVGLVELVELIISASKSSPITIARMTGSISRKIAADRAQRGAASSGSHCDWARPGLGRATTAAVCGEARDKARPSAMSMEHGSVSSDEEDMEAIELHRRLAADEDDELDLSTTAASEPAAAVPSTALARAVNEAASEGRTADALALIAEELSSVREDQRALVSLVHESFARTDAALAALAERLGSPGIVAHSPRASASAVAPPPPLSGPRSGTPSSGASRAEASPGSRFAARLGISTSLYDDAPRIPVHIWTGTWNVGASEPVGGAKGCTEADLQAFAPRGFDVYALAVQEAMTDRVFDAFAAATGSVRIPMLPITHATRAATAETGGATSAADSLGHGGTGSSMATSHGPMLAPPLGSAGSAFGSASERRESSATTTAATHAGLDRVLGRGDGSLVSLKFTGLALFVSEAMLPHFRLLRVDRLSFGTTEGSKGAVAAVVRIHGSTVTIVSCHLASKRIDMRFDQYCDVCKTLGAKVRFRRNEYARMPPSYWHSLWWCWCFVWAGRQ